MRIGMHIILSCLLLTAALPAVAETDGPLQVENAWIREAPPGSATLAGYLTLVNRGATPVTISEISSPEFGAAEIHLSRVENGVAKMIAVGNLEIPAGSSVMLQPGGYHLMLFRPVRELHAGDTVTLHLYRADGACLLVNAPVLRNNDTDQRP